MQNNFLRHHGGGGLDLISIVTHLKLCLATAIHNFEVGENYSYLVI